MTSPAPMNSIINFRLTTTALHLAAQAGSSGCVRALLASGADPNLVDNIQQTPLFPAVEGGNSKCIEAVSLKTQRMEAISISKVPV